MRSLTTAFADDRKFLTPQEAGRLLGVAEETIVAWMDRGLLKGDGLRGEKGLIPRATAQALLVRQEGAHVDASQGEAFSILVVEDEPALLEYYKIFIESWGLPIRLTLAETGFGGLICVGAERPDLIVADLVMPGMDGLEMIRRLREHKELWSMTIVAVSNLNPQEIEEGGGIPEDVVLFPKPVPFERLEDLVRRLIQRKHG